jgi:hypothetical protein
VIVGAGVLVSLVVVLGVLTRDADGEPSVWAMN